MRPTDLFAIRPDGTGLRQLTTSVDANGGPGQDTFPSVSPDGKLVAFVRSCDCRPSQTSTDTAATAPGQLFVVGIDGTGAHQLTNGNSNDQDPSWGR